MCMPGILIGKHLVHLLDMQQSAGIKHEIDVQKCGNLDFDYVQ